MPEMDLTPTDQRSSVKVLYLLGSPRSGTTVISRLLGELDGFFLAGEVRKLWPVLARSPEHQCGCGARLTECPTWAKVLGLVYDREPTRDPEAMLRRQWAAIGRQRHWLRALPLLLDSRGALPLATTAHADVLTSVYMAISEVSGARVIVDSSKRSDQAALLRLLPDVSCYLLHVVRDPHGVLFSHYRRAYPRSPSSPHPIDAARRSAAWLADNASASLLRWRHSPKYSLLLNYDDFVTDPAGTLQQICQLLDETPHHLPLDASRQTTLSTSHTVHGNENRFITGSIAIRNDDAWRSQLHWLDRFITTMLTMPLSTTRRPKSSENSGATGALQ